MGDPSQKRKWKPLYDHKALQAELKEIRLKRLRCIRMMGTMIGAAGRAEVGHEDYGEPFTEGLVEQTAALLFCNWEDAQSMLVIGSANRAVPVDQAPYQFYTYLFISRLVYRLIHLLQSSQKEKDKYCAGRARSRTKSDSAESYDQLVLRFTFVHEDILFAQFFYDEDYLVIAATYSWSTLEEIQHQGAYTAVYLDNTKRREKGAAGRPLHFPDTSRRLVEIFDARFREQTAGLGQEVWTIKRLNEQDYGVLVETPFWRESNSVLRAFNFDSAGESTTIELGRNGLKRFISQIEYQIGPSPVRPRPEPEV